MRLNKKRKDATVLLTKVQQQRLTSANKQQKKYNTNRNTSTKTVLEEES